jgi:hypothetical protein
MFFPLAHSPQAKISRRGEQRVDACGEIIDEIANMNDRAHDDDGCTVVEQFSSLFFLQLLTGVSRGGVNDPLQRPRLKIQFAFCLGIRHPAHLSPVVNRIRTTRFQSTLNRYLRRRWSIQPLSKRREPFAHR